MTTAELQRELLEIGSFKRWPKKSIVIPNMNTTIQLVFTIINMFNICLNVMVVCSNLFVDDAILNHQIQSHFNAELFKEITTGDRRRGWGSSGACSRYSPIMI